METKKRIDMIVRIKNMVCERCKMLVKTILANMNLEYTSVDLGVLELPVPLTGIQKGILRNQLSEAGLQLIDDNNEVLVDKIKLSIINMIRNDATISTLKTSHYLSQYLGYNYTYLANVFSHETGICLRDYIIAHRIEKVKEMLVYEDLSVTQIAWELNYSSVAHLSNQFNKITGYTPSQFKKQIVNRFIPLDQIGITKQLCTT